MIFYIVQLFFLPVIAYFVYWFFQVQCSTEQANFRNTKRMNWIAAICMNSCSLILIFFFRIPVSYISAIETAVPEHAYTQETLTSFYLKSTDTLISKRKIKIVAEKTEIETPFCAADLG
jgi:mannose/fructose/N-acetylgalactosamine-specific phosphotransferase system component IIC